MPDRGEVILAILQFVDPYEVKAHPVLVLFEKYGNVVVAGIMIGKRRVEKTPFQVV